MEVIGLREYLKQILWKFRLFTVKVRQVWGGIILKRRWPENLGCPDFKIKMIGIICYIHQQ